MATASDILILRGNVNELADADPYTDAALGMLVDAMGVAGASRSIWQRKAAEFSTMVDVSEAGASHKFSSLFDHAKTLALYWESQEATAPDAPTAADGHPRVTRIVRVS